MYRPHLQWNCKYDSSLVLSCWIFLTIFQPNNQIWKTCSNWQHYYMNSRRFPKNSHCVLITVLELMGTLKYWYRFQSAHAPIFKLWLDSGKSLRLCNIYFTYSYYPSLHLIVSNLTFLLPGFPYLMVLS